jgi:hypothetical protein
MRLCFRAFDAVKLMTSGASPIAQMFGAVSVRHGNSCLTREGYGPGKVKDGLGRRAAGAKMGMGMGMGPRLQRSL